PVPPSRPRVWGTQSISQGSHGRHGRSRLAIPGIAPRSHAKMKASTMTTTSAVVPEPVAVTPELLATHGITAEEYERIPKALGRVPSLTELGIYSVMWSEHCSYKSSRVHLKRLPTKSNRVVQ